jgi:peroxiredoxin Q/BCP
MAKALKVGDKAPDFKLLNQDKEEISLKKYDKQWVVLYFYPKDNTPGCTIEAKEFTDLLPQFQKANTQIIGISKDTQKSHCAFMTSHGLQIPLISDENLELHRHFDTR